MNYTLTAYLICMLLVASILIQPGMHIVSLRSEGLEKIFATDYWLTLNALIYIYGKEDSIGEFNSFLNSELNFLNPRIIEVPNVTVQYLNVTGSRIEVQLTFRRQWTVHRIHIFLKAEIVDRSVKHNPERNELTVTLKVKFYSDRPVHIYFKVLDGELLKIKNLVDQTFEIYISKSLQSISRLVATDSRGLKVTINV
ncbi:MAG: hypothetical protein NDF56_08155 [archaeon GB-1845-036]|nr:hypothetical protein [Candidatus Culexmicrobium thermophilum]